jgi:hypothetical protein
MVAGKAIQPPDLLVATVSGVLTADDQAELVQWVRDAISTRGLVRVLLLLDRFGGWDSSDDHHEWLHDDDAVSRIAIVGSAEWKLPVLTFMVAPIRRTPIAYFESERAARRWLESSSRAPDAPVAPNRPPAA